MENKKSPARYISKLANELRRKTESFPFSKRYSGAQWRTLHFILNKKDDVFQRDIEREFNIRSSSATELLKQLENNGLIRKESVPHDNRLRKIVATDKAHTCQDEIFGQLDALDQTLVQRIPGDKLEIYFEVVEIMMDNLSK